MFPAIKRGVLTFLGVLGIFGCIWMALVYLRIYHLVFSIRKDDAIQENSLDGRARATKRSTDIMFLIVIVCIACYSPYLIYIYATIYGYHQNIRLAVNCTWTALLSNSLSNPVCYCVKNKQIRKAWLKFLQRWRCSQQREPRVGI